MYSFKNDYSEGAHPSLLSALIESNLEQAAGYGEDYDTLKALKVIKNKIARNDIDIHLLTGGTQTNLIAISAFLRPHEAVIAANTGHVFTHETGAIEATGHKVLTAQVSDGKISPSHILPILDEHTDEHMVKPKLVYISNPTEVGTIYSKCELEELSLFCKERNLLFYVDGARLGSALMSSSNDLELSDFARLTDAFYIGGTKNGALLGEALVICNDTLKEDFRFHMKQKGALLAKGKVLGIQFYELFKENLYFDLANHANQMADRLKQGIQELGLSFITNSPTNQLFPILPIRVIEKLEEKYSFHRWEQIDANNYAIRLVTSWATKGDMVEEFLKDLKESLTSAN